MSNSIFIKPYYAYNRTPPPPTPESLIFVDGAFTQSSGVALATGAAYKSAYPLAETGLYWINPDGGDSPFKIHVNMDILGGGWMLIGKSHTILQPDQMIDGVPPVPSGTSYVTPYHLHDVQWQRLNKPENMVDGILACKNTNINKYAHISKANLLYTGSAYVFTIFDKTTIHTGVTSPPNKPSAKTRLFHFETSGNNQTGSDYTRMGMRGGITSMSIIKLTFNGMTGPNDTSTTFDFYWK